MADLECNITTWRRNYGAETGVLLKSESADAASEGIKSEQREAEVVIYSGVYRWLYIVYKGNSGSSKKYL